MEPQSNTALTGPPRSGHLGLYLTLCRHTGEVAMSAGAFSKDLIAPLF